MEGEIMTDQEMIDLEPEILKACKDRVLFLDQLSRLVVKERWPRTNELTTTLNFEDSKRNEYGVSYSTRTYQLQHAAVQSGRIAIEDEVDKGWIKRSMSDVALWLWAYYFQGKLLELIQNRMVVRDLSDVSNDRTVELTRIMSSSPRRVNIFGKSVKQFLKQPSSVGIKMVLNPKYKRAAEQVIFFHPDTVHFQFPDVKQWIGEIQWKNVPDPETNPDGKIGFYRLITTAAAKPIFPEFGLVVTVVPKGLRGLIYFWAWKLFRFIP